jgi:hypothetical protein
LEGNIKQGINLLPCYATLNYKVIKLTRNAGEMRRVDDVWQKSIKPKSCDTDKGRFLIIKIFSIK